MRQLTNRFNPYDIFFENIGYDEIYDSQYNTNFYNSNYNMPQIISLFNTQKVYNAVNIYLLDDNSKYIGGQASDIGGRYNNNFIPAIVVGGLESRHGRITSCVNSAVMAHEMGHILGLLHTFDPFGDGTGLGTELVSRFQCTQRGDMVCDTPAESVDYIYTEGSNCLFPQHFYDSQGMLQNPDTNNIMDYIATFCMNHFTPGQADRMHAVIAANILNGPSAFLSGVINTTPPPSAFPSPVFSRTSYPTVCTAGGITRFSMYVTPMPGATSYTWSLSSANQQASIIATYNNGIEAKIEFQPGDYLQSISVTANYSCGSSASTSQVLSVTSVPPPAPDLSPVYDICSGTAGQAFLPILNYGPYSTYRFTLPNNVSLSSNNAVNIQGYWGFLFNTTNTNSFKVTVEASNSCGGITSSSIIREEDCPWPSNKMEAYPNPATESITVQSGIEGAVLLNSQGQIVQKAGNSNQLDVRQLPAGLYNLQMRSKGKLYNRHIEVKH